MDRRRRLAIRPLDDGKLGTSSLAGIITDLCTRAGLATADFDVSALTNQVNGFVMTKQQSIRNGIEALQNAYFFDTAETDYVLKFIPRGGISQMSIAEDSIVPTQSEKQDQVLIITRKQEAEIPNRVNVGYMSPLNNYQPATQFSQREVTSSQQTTSVNLPLVLDDQTAKTIADITLYTGWVARNSYKFYVPIQYIVLEPCDVITVTAASVPYVMRITSTSFAAPGALQISAVAEDISIYDFYTPPGYTPTLTGQRQPISSTTLEFLDIAALPGDPTDQGVLRFAAAGVTANWNGAALYRSDDGGSTYTFQIPLPSASIMGTALTALAARQHEVFDIANTVNVSLMGDDTLASATQLAVLNGANAAILGSEIIQFMTATLTSPGNYTLSGLLRGRQGTEWAMGLHAAGEPFVLLNSLVGSEDMSNALINLERPYKPVSVGATLSATPEDDFTYAGVALLPYAPVHISGARDGSGNLTINWIRRTRVSGEWQDYVDAPLNETSEAYEVDILSGSTVLRTLTGLTSPTASYSAALQTTDFGSPQSSISINVYQLSGVVGRGYAGAAVV